MMRRVISCGRRRDGFTLVEVIVALTIAAVAITYMYEAISVTLTAEERMVFFDRCTRFLGDDFETKLLEAVQSGTGEYTGQLSGEGRTITYVMNVSESDDLQGLLEVTLTLQGEGRRVTHSASLTTHYTELLHIRKESTE